jgi:signal transduction histidine kinase
MTNRAMHMLTGKRAGWVAGGVVVSVAILAVVGYRAVTEWQHSAALLAQRRADAAAEQLLTALTRDMRGAQTSVLAAMPLDLVTPDLLLDLGFVGSAFARYPYVEAFFASIPRRNGQSHMTYYVRTDRMPPWLPSAAGEVFFPVVPTQSLAADALLLPAVNRSALEGRQFATFDVRFNGLPYQIVAFLRYEDVTREQLASIVGFAVNLDWVRSEYFKEIVTQILRMQGPDPGLALRISDEAGATVAETAPTGDGPASVRRFPLLFFSPGLVALDPPTGLARVYWTAHAATANDRALVAARAGARRTMSIAAATALVLALGFAVTLQAARTNARLTTMRSEFVSAVTHELKAPIATIRAASETLALGRRLDPERSREYAELAVRESKRLTRLIDNLLAYARITDLTEAYSFDFLDAGALVRQVIRDFDSQLTAGAFVVRLDIPTALPAIRADRPALTLAFGNLVDNAIRYSAERRSITFSAREDEAWVVVEVIDAGVGIPTHELPRVTQRFYRGERAGAGGSGLGLAIVQRIIDDHDGTLSIASTEGVGTTVTLRLPHAGVDGETAHSDS